MTEETLAETDCCSAVTAARSPGMAVRNRATVVRSRETAVDPCYSPV